MNESTLIVECWEALDFELDSCISRYTDGYAPVFGDMIRYQLGWNGASFDKRLSGKRIRPMILLLTTHALGGEWEQVIPAAAAVELVHNFSLVHDDIQDKSEKRRGRDTVWVRWGEAQAINTGDAMLAIANLEITSLKLPHDPIIVTNAARILSQATFDLTKGQFLDLANEKTEDATMQDYFRMVEGKTGALFSGCFALGALLAGIKQNEIKRFSALGSKLGLAFQIQDDYLGIWGQKRIIGKSIESDLVSKKKTYPANYALENLPEVRAYWQEHSVFSPEDVNWIKGRLESTGVDKITLAAVADFYEESIEEFEELFTEHESSAELRSMIKNLFLRNR